MGATMSIHVNSIAQWRHSKRGKWVLAGWRSPWYAMPSKRLSIIIFSWVYALRIKIITGAKTKTVSKILLVEETAWVKTFFSSLLIARSQLHLQFIIFPIRQIIILTCLETARPYTLLLCSRLKLAGNRGKFFSPSCFATDHILWLLVLNEAGMQMVHVDRWETLMVLRGREWIASFRALLADAVATLIGGGEIICFAVLINRWDRSFFSPAYSGLLNSN